MERGWIGKERLNDALDEQKSSAEFLGKILLRKKYLSEEQLIQALSEQFRLPFLRPKNFYVNWDLAGGFSASLILEHHCFPLIQKDNTLTMGITNPLDAWALGKVEEETKGRRVQFALVLESEMRELLDRYRRYANIRIRHRLDQGG